MTDASLTVELVNPVQARAALVEQAFPWIKGKLQAERRVLAEFREIEDDRTIKQMRFYWGPLLGDISEQAQIGGARYSKDAWHELFKRQFLPRKTKKSKVAGRARPVVSVSIGSTQGLSVRKMSVYIEKIQAFASTDLGVQFRELYVEPAKPAPKRREVVDAETGEITEAA